MKKNRGYTLVELVVFIVIISIITGTLLLTLVGVPSKIPQIQDQAIATQLASRCIELYLGERYMKGYGSITCPSTSVPAFCSAPSGYTIATNVSCTTKYGSSSYKTITVTVGGKGDATLSLTIADY